MAMISVLYVDDERDLLEVAQLFIEQAGDIHVRTALSAKEALDLPEIGSFDAIISDYLMPGMDGIAFLKAVRQQHGDIPFILFTGRGREEVVIDAINNGADFYLQKGGDPEAQFAELAHKVRQAVRRRKAEINRIQSEEKFSKLFITNPSLEAITDFSNAILVDINEAYLKTTGYSREELIGKSVRDLNIFVDYADRERMAQILKNGGIVQHFETQIRTKTGEIRTLDLTGQRIRAGDRDLLFSQAVDITERKRAERSVQESEKRLSDIINFLPDATFAIDRTGVVIAWNRAIEDMTGVVAGDMLGKGEYEYAVPFYGTRRPILIDLIFEPDNIIRERYSHIIHEKDILIAETALPHPKGRTVTLMGKASPLYNRQGEIVGAIESIRDITGLKKAEQDLRKSEEWFRVLIQNSSDMIRIIGRDGRITYTSPSTKRIVGYDPSELIGKNPFEYVHPDDHELAQKVLNEVQGEGHPHTPTEYRLCHANGQYVDVEAIASNLLDVPEINGIVVTIRPITERKRAEELRRESERTIRINEERLRMAQEIARTGSWEYSPATNMIWGSAEGLRIFGFPQVAGNIPIADIEACIPERNRVNKALADLISQGKEYNLEYSINPADGSPQKIIHSVARLEKDPAGNPVRVIGVIQDITESGRAKEEISVKNAILSAQQEASLDGILVVDENSKILSFNQNFITIWRIPAELLATRADEPVLQYVVAQLADPDVFLSRVRYLYDHKDEKSFEELLLKDGRVLERFSSPVVGKTGKYYGRVWYFRDISGRKRTEEALRESEAKYRRLIETSLEGIWILDAEFRVSFANSRMAAILGYPVEEMQGHCISDFISPDESEEAEQEMGERRNGICGHFERKHVRKDGSLVTLLVSATPIIGEDGSFQGTFSMCTDISDRKQAEEALAESEAKFRGMADRISDIVLLVDKDFNLTYVSPSFLAMTGRRKSDLLGKPLPISQLSPSVQENVKAAFRDNMALKPTGPLEISYNIPERSSLVLEFHGVPIEEGGVFQGVQLVAHDITSLRRAQDELRSAYEQLTAAEEELRGQYDEIAKSKQDLVESEEQYKTLFEGASDAIIIADRTTILNCNHSTEVLFGCSRDQFINHPLTDFSPKRQPDGQLSKEIARVKIDSALSGEPQFFEWIHLRYDHSPFYADISLNRILIRGVYYIQGIVRDITERKRAEDALRESEKKFSMVFRSSPVALTLVSATDGVFVDVNDAFVRNTGFTREEIIGKTAEQLKLIPGEENRRRMISALQDHQEIHGMEVSCRIKTGEIRTCLFSSSKIMMSGTLHILSTIEDITERKATEFAVQAMVRSIVGSTGLNSLRKITENISAWLGTECVMVGEIQPDNETVKVLSMLFDGEEVENFSYTLKGTPCEDVRERGFCCYPDNAVELFPDAKDIVELNIRSYIGTPLRDSSGNVFGILCALSRNPLPAIPSLQEIIDIIAVKASAELESMKMTRALRESEQKFRSLVEYSLEGILITDLQGCVLFANNSIGRMLELEDHTRIIGRNVMEFVAPESQKDALNDFSEVARGHDAYLAQYKVITAKGNEIYVESLGKVISYDGITADLISIHDVTERKRAEDALNRSQHLLAEAMDLARLVNWEYDFASGMFTFDDRFYALYGTTAEREGGNLMPAEVYAREFVHPDDRHLVGEEVERALTATDPDYTARIEHRIIRRDGAVRHIVVRIAITKNAEGQTIKTRGANQDITEIKLAEEALLESEERFRSLVETTPGIIWEIDKLGKIQYISPMVKEIQGYEPEELIGKPFKDLILEQFQPLLMRTLASMALSSEGPLMPFEVIARHHKGHDLVLEIRPSRVMGISGNVIGFRGVAFDTTKRKNAEEALKRANRQLNLLGSITRHDLLNKITVILGNLKIAERKCSDTEQAEHLRKIRYATSAIKSQIEFTRVYQNLGTHEPQWISLETVMPHAHVPPAITLKTAVQDIEILADPMLERVFFNLIDNSIRHGEKVTEILVSSFKSGENLIVVWEDNGVGIAADEKERIFERGFGKNTGLGMFLAREILALTRITIRETGEPGKGSRFEIIVPKGAYRSGRPVSDD